MGGFLSGLIGGYGETVMGMQERDYRREMDRRKARLDILKAAIPNIQDPSLQAEAFGLMEEIATGKGGKKKGGGLGSMFTGLIGRGSEDTGQGEKLQEFMGRPRETEVRPPIRMPGVELPPIPGQTSGIRLSDERMAPGVTETVRGPLPTHEELMGMRGMELRGEAKIKQQIEQENRNFLEAEAKRIGLSDPRDIANYVNQRTLPSEYDVNRVVNVAGTVPGVHLKTYMQTDSLGNPIRDDLQYHITRRADGTIASATPASTRLAEGDFFQHPASRTSYARRMYDPMTGQEIAPQLHVLPPAGWAPTTSTTHGYRQVTQADGSIVLVPVTTTSTRERTPTGSQPATLPPVPGGPTGAQPETQVPPTTGAPQSLRDNIQQLIMANAAQHGVDPRLALAVAEQESGLDPNATGRKGDGGVFQLMPETARQLGVQNVYDAQQNIDAGVRYLKYLLDKYGGDVETALMAYNGGEGNVDRNTVSDEAKGYPARVLARQAATAAGPQPGAVVGVQPRPQPGQAVGAQPGADWPVRTGDGRILVGHKALTTTDRRDIGRVALSLRLAQELKNVLDMPQPQTEQKLRDRTGTMQQLADTMGARWGAFRYGTLGMTSGTEFLQKTMALTNLARVIQVSPFLQGVRAHQWVVDIQRHIPDASWQTPAGMAERLDTVVPMLESMKRDLMNGLGLTPQQMDEFMGEALQETGIAAGQTGGLPEVPAPKATTQPPTQRAKPVVPPNPW